MNMPDGLLVRVTPESRLAPRRGFQEFSMSSRPRLSGFSRELPLVIVFPLVLAVTIALICWSAMRPQVIDAAALAEDPSPWLGRDLAVRGAWIRSLPADAEYLIVVLRGSNGIFIECHCDDISVIDSAALAHLHQRIVTSVTLRGRCRGLDGNRVILRDCRLLN